MPELKLSPPWITFYHEVEALFAEDSDVLVLFDEDDLTVRLIVTDEEKAKALDAIMLHNVTFGNVTITVTVKYSEPNEDKFAAKVRTFRKAFANNPAVTDILVAGNPIISQAGFVMFKKEVVQFFNDDLGDPFGRKSMLFQDIAEDVMDPEHSGIYFSTAGD